MNAEPSRRARRAWIVAILVVAFGAALVGAYFMVRPSTEGCVLKRERAPLVGVSLRPAWNDGLEWRCVYRYADGSSAEAPWGVE